jgi:hypothetical protein
MPTSDYREIELYAWLGLDEFGAGVVGIKQAFAPAGFIPMVAVERAKMEQELIRKGLTLQAKLFGNTIRLCRFVFAEVIEEVP